MEYTAYVRDSEITLERFIEEKMIYSYVQQDRQFSYIS